MATRKWDQQINSLPVEDEFKAIINTGNPGPFLNALDAEKATYYRLKSLEDPKLDHSDFVHIWANNPIGARYQQSSSQNDYFDQWMDEYGRWQAKHQKLTPKEWIDPKFHRNILSKKSNDGSNSYKLDIPEFQEYMREKCRILKIGDLIIRYNGKCYEVMDEDAIKLSCGRELSGRLDYRRLFEKSQYEKFDHFIRTDPKANPAPEVAREHQMRYLTMENGLFDLYEDKLIPHTPALITTNLLPYPYDPSAKCPRWERYTTEVFLDNRGRIDKSLILLVQEIGGYCLHKGMPVASMFFLVGEGENGKSVFIKTLINVFGQHNTCTVSLKNIEKDHYVIKLVDKMLNVSTETTRKLLETENLKAATDGDQLTGKGLYRNPTEFTPFAKHFFAMNQRPQIDDPTHGFWRRLYMIPFLATFPAARREPDLAEKLAAPKSQGGYEELPGIFNWFLEGYRRLKANNFIFSVPEHLDKEKEAYREECNSALEYINWELTLTGKEEDVMLWKDVRAKYRWFCEQGGLVEEQLKVLRGITQSKGVRVDKDKDGMTKAFGVRLATDHEKAYRHAPPADSCPSDEEVGKVLDGVNLDDYEF